MSLQLQPTRHHYPYDGMIRHLNFVYPENGDSYTYSNDMEGGGEGGRGHKHITERSDVIEVRLRMTNQ